uniref:Methylated-DNA-[protein]-cysteine S-methyltransferase DNA binding domain-containing protein n=1 Tax=Schlesneria paludicola TaxID=360056 RepID=A0A7C4LNL5_9PLAN
MPSVRAEAVAEVLWELKRLEKLATWTGVAKRAGFKAGVGGKNLLNCLETVKRDWPHLQWWRIVPDHGQIATNSEQVHHLRSAGYLFEPLPDRPEMLRLVDHESHLCVWEEAAAIL